MAIRFHKYQGTGNDFIILDGRGTGFVTPGAETIRKLCHRRFGIGSDGLMILGMAEGVDFSMGYYNADGNPGSMCGNGARCIVQFAYDMGMRRPSYRFTAPDGLHDAEMDMGGNVRLRMNDVSGVEEADGDYILDTGSPHYVRFTQAVRDLDVFREGRLVRNSKRFSAQGINVNFVEPLDEHKIYVRTYERGVEDETYSCGTGVTASALMSAHNDAGFNEVEVRTRGGHLSVEFEKVDEDRFKDIWLIGPACKVFEGTIDLEPR